MILSTKPTWAGPVSPNGARMRQIVNIGLGNGGLPVLILNPSAYRDDFYMQDDFCILNFPHTSHFLLVNQNCGRHDLFWIAIATYFVSDYLNQLPGQPQHLQ